MRIDWWVDVEGTTSGGIDPDDLCGEMTLIYDESIINDNFVYLENWFDCLVDACGSLSREGIFKCDLISEPDPLVFCIDKNGITVSYKVQKIKNIPLNKFYYAVVDAGERLISRLEAEVPEKERTSLRKLETFLKNK